MGDHNFKEIPKPLLDSKMNPQKNSMKKGYESYILGTPHLTSGRNDCPNICRHFGTKSKNKRWLLNEQTTLFE